VQRLSSDEGEDPVSDVSGIAVSPEGDNVGDLFVATNAGFVILDISDATELQPIGRPLPIGREYVHRPPSYMPPSLVNDPDNPEDEYDRLLAAQEARGARLSAIGARPSLDRAGVIEVVSGNPFWMVELDYPVNRDFSTRCTDPLADDEANAVLAVGVGAQTAVVMLQGRGVVWRGGAGSADCMLKPSAERGCPAPPGDACAIGASDGPPADAVDIAVSPDDGRYWIASSDGVRRFDPDTGRFVLLQAAGISGAATAVDVRGGVVAVGTAEGLRRVDIGDVQ
jgi:hypothetical protein